jgi:phytol kinase
MKKSFFVMPLLLLSHYYSVSFTEGLSFRLASNLQSFITNRNNNINSIHHNNENIVLSKNLFGTNYMTKQRMIYQDNKNTPSMQQGRRHGHGIGHGHGLSSTNGDNDDSLTTASTSSSSKGPLLGVFVTYFASIVALAKLDLIGLSYTNELILRDSGAAVLSTVLALIFVKLITTLSAKGVLQPRDSRKIIHTLSAPLFILFWPLFSDVWGSRLFAASVPLLQAIRLYLAAMKSGGSDGNELAGAISRSGDEKEALGGPFIYVIILFVSIIACFTDNFTGIMALSAMAAGDGMADIIGRRFGKGNKWFFNEDKSIAGTVAFIVASSLCSIGLGFYLQYVGVVTIAVPFMDLVGKFVAISAISAFIELVPFGDDNWSVPVSAAVLSLLILR